MCIAVLDGTSALAARNGADPRVAGDVFHAMFMNVAVAAENLHAEVRRLQSHFGEEAFKDRRIKT